MTVPATMKWTIGVLVVCMTATHAFFSPAVPRTLTIGTCQRPAMSVATQTEYKLDGKPVGAPLDPLANWVLVKVRSADETSLGGIVLPDKSKERPTEGVVVALGSGRKHLETGAEIPMPCKVGDKVLYGKYDGTKVNYMDADHHFIRDEDVMFVYSGDKMTADTIKVMRDQVLVKVDNAEPKTSSGLFLAPSDSESGATQTTGEVAAVGPGRMSWNGDLVLMTVQTGDLVLFRDFAGVEVKMQGQAYRVMKNAEILAKW